MNECKTKMSVRRRNQKKNIQLQFKEGNEQTEDNTNSLLKIANETYPTDCRQPPLIPKSPIEIERTELN